MKAKRIGTFRDYLKEQRQQKINESNVSIEVDWWDQCIVEVLQDLEDSCSGCFGWTALGDFIKAKFSILGRTFDEYLDNIYILHIKDLIFQHHGQSFCVDTSNDNTELHTKGLVIEQLAQVIYDKLCEKLGDGENFNGPTVKVVDAEPTTIVAVKPIPVSPDEDDDLCDVLPFECNNVKKFEDFLTERKGGKDEKVK